MNLLHGDVSSSASSMLSGSTSYVEVSHIHCWGKGGVDSCIALVVPGSGAAASKVLGRMGESSGPLDPESPLNGNSSLVCALGNALAGYPGLWLLLLVGPVSCTLCGCQGEIVRDGSL